MKSLIRKKGGLVGDLISGSGGIVITVVIIFVIVSTILGAGLLTSGSTYDNSAAALGANLTAGVDNVATKIPTVLLVAAVVLLIGVLAILMKQAGTMGITGGRSASL